MPQEAAIGVIGGSGLYEMDGLEAIDVRAIETPFGHPSGPYTIGRLAGRRMVFLARHGEGHRLLPHEINFRANIWGMKSLGVGEILSVSAVGSMKESIAPGDLVLVDQFIDRTRHRAGTFYGDGIVVHVPLADPVCPTMRSVLRELSADVSGRTHDGGTYLCMEGPQFSTRAESMLYRSFGVDVIGMTNMPEAKLAREAEICYATIALATDYDCWHASAAPVSVEAVLKVLREEVERAKLLIDAFAKAPARAVCELCPRAVRTSLMTPPERIPPETRARLEPILSAFLP